MTSEVFPMSSVHAKKKQAGAAGKGAIYIGTSGFSYPEWVGHFYPAGTRGEEMLHYYAGKLNTVEVNNTFYRLPAPEVIKGWRASAGPGFHFAVKASQRITHRPGFGLDDGFLTLFLTRVALLKENLGALLFQFPPYFGDKVKALEFVGHIQNHIPRLVHAAPVMEVRSPKLLNPDFFKPLSDAGIALCLNDEYLEPAQWPEPGDIAYLRLRNETYPPKEMKAFARLLKKWSGQGKDCYVFFQHEGRATDLAMALKKLI
jgi:uncharacterized protein YecE (DUF72 family)